MDKGKVIVKDGYKQIKDEKKKIDDEKKKKLVNDVKIDDTEWEDLIINDSDSDEETEEYQKEIATKTQKPMFLTQSSIRSPKSGTSILGKRIN